MEARENEDDSTQKISKRTVIIDNKEIGTIEIAFDGNTAHIADVKLSQQKEGHGTELYLQLGEELAQKGITLFSGSNRNDAANGLWDSLARIGRAKISPHPRNPGISVYEYIPGNE